MYPQNTASRELQVKVKMMALQLSIELLEKDVSTLDERLRVISSSDSPMPDKNQTFPSELCPMANEIQEAVRKIESLRGRLESIMSRLEV